MKKLIATLLACAMLCSCSFAFAAQTPSIDFLKSNAFLSDVEQSGTISFKLNKPFELLQLITENTDSDAMSDYIDVAMLFESVFDSTMAVHSKSKITNDGKKCITEAHIKSDIPFKANSNLEGNVKANYSVWNEFDFTDAENPYFDTIMTHPFAVKYITVNSDLVLENGEATEEELSEICKVLFDNINLGKLNDNAIDSIERNASITGNSKKVRIAFTDIGLKMYLVDVIVPVLKEIDESLLESYDEAAVKEALAKVPVFGKEALVMEYTLDSKGRISEDKITLNVDLNIYDLAVTLTGDVPPSEMGITREKCELDFTVTGQTSYKYSSVEIKKPVLTEENSIDIFEYQDPYYYAEPDYDEYYEDYDYYSSWTYADFDANCFENGELKYVGLRSFFEGAGYSVSYENGVIKAQLESEHVKYKAFCFIPGFNVTYTDVHDVVLDAPVLFKDGTTYISIKDCEALTNFTKDGIYYYFETNDGYIDFEDNVYMYGEEYDY